MIIGVDIRPLMDSEPSGVSHQLYKLLDNLFKIDRKNQYKLFYNSFSQVKDRLPKWDYPNVKFYGFRYPNKFLNFFGFQFLHWPKVDKLIGGCDVFLISNLCSIVLSKECKKIITVHDLSFELYKGFFNPKWRLNYWLINPRKFITSADKLISVSENTKRDLVSLYGIEEGKVEVVYPGIESQMAEVRSQMVEIDLPEKFILTLGTREPRKNLVGVIQAFEKIKSDDSGPAKGAGRQMSDVRLVIAGGGGWLNKEVNQLIKRSKFKSEIKILGYVSEEVKNELYRRAEVFLYPSFYEGFGFPPLEAMSCGCPVITSLSSSTSEICGQAAVLVDPYNINELVEAIKGITNYKECGEERVKEFNWARTANKTLEIINNI